MADALPDIDGTAVLDAKLRTAGWWARRCIGVDRSVDKAIVDSCRLCDRVIVFSPGARANLHAFFRFRRADELVPRVVVAPYPVEESFEVSPLLTDKLDQILAIGRWADPQKAAGLLADTLAELVRRREPSRLVVIGPGGETVFGPLARAYPSRVVYRGAVAQAEVLDLFNQSRVLLSTSRWESGPIVAAEAVLRGCTVVGSRSIPSFRRFSNAGCGTVFATRGPRTIANAVQDEARALEGWSARPPGDRGSVARVFHPATSVHADPREPECWRPRLDRRPLGSGGRHRPGSPTRSLKPAHSYSVPAMPGFAGDETIRLGCARPLPVLGREGHSPPGVTNGK